MGAPRRARLLRDGAGHGAFNMGVDEALLAAAAAGVATLRFYEWDGPWLSLGYAQAAAPGLGARAGAAGVGLVRRATGGAAVLHGCDLTYAVAAPEAWLPEGIAGTYEVISEGLVEGLRALGVRAERHGAPVGATPRRFDCFEAPAADELVAGGRKLAGSAQRRAGGGVLQHGSVRLAPDPGAALRAAGLGGAGATDLSSLGVPGEAGAVAEALARALARVLGLAIEPGRLTKAERAVAAARLQAHAREPLAAPPSIQRRSQGLCRTADTSREG